MFPEQPIAVRTSTLIGRVALLEAITTALRSTDTEALFFVGPGGIGKTRLLEEAKTLFAQTGVAATEIIDLYHTRHRTPEGVRTTIADDLDREGTIFAAFRAGHDEYQRLLKAGGSRQTLEMLYRKQEELFLENYQTLAKQRRIVLRFDTVELLQGESDLVQELCQVRDNDVAVKNWLLYLASVLPNTVFLLAGRPYEPIASELRSGFERARCPLVEYPLEVFSKAELKTYVEAVRDELSEEQRTELDWVLDQERLEWLYTMTGGRPISLMLYLELLVHGEVPQSSAKPSEFDAALFDCLRALSPGHPAFQMEYLFRARKGLDAGLLHYLAGANIPEPEIEPTLRALTKFSFVKYREEPLPVATTSNTPRKLRLFLHDELYEIYDRFFAGKPSARLDYGSYVDYYGRAVADANEHEREELILSQLSYLLQSAPKAGFYRHFSVLNDEAIQSHAIDFDLGLRDEVLRFFIRYGRRGQNFFDPTVHDSVSLAEVERDCALRWVMRYYARGNYPLAIAVAETLATSQDPTLRWETLDDPLYKAALLVEWAVALLQVGRAENEILPKLEDACKLLPDSAEYDENLKVRRKRIVGRAYTHIGYLHRTRGRYGHALNFYLKALPYYDKETLPSDRASTLNNLAMVQALLERLNPARVHVNEALAIRERLGRPYPIGLSKNTLGIIYTMKDRPDLGIARCREARQIFDSLNENRGIGLADIALGYSLRKRADQWKTAELSTEEANDLFSEGEQLLKEAWQIFTRGLNEPLRAWEAGNELGSLYCDWGWLVRHDHRLDQATAHRRSRELYELSERTQNEALAIAREQEFTFQMIDSYDDLAQLHNDMSVLLRSMGEKDEARLFREQADQELDQVRVAIPKAYQLEPHTPTATDPNESGPYWRALGKLHLQRSRRVFQDLAANLVLAADQKALLAEGTREMLIAGVYFKKYQQHSFSYDRIPIRLAELLTGYELPYSWIDPIISDVETTYGEKLTLVREMLSDVLGI